MWELGIQTQFLTFVQPALSLWCHAPSLLWRFFSFCHVSCFPPCVFLHVSHAMGETVPFPLLPEDSAVVIGTKVKYRPPQGPSFSDRCMSPMWYSQHRSLYMAHIQDTLLVKSHGLQSSLIPMWMQKMVVTWALPSNRLVITPAYLEMPLPLHMRSCDSLAFCTSSSQALNFQQVRWFVRVKYSFVFKINQPTQM